MILIYSLDKLLCVCVRALEVLSPLTLSGISALVCAFGKSIADVMNDDMLFYKQQWH